MRPGQHGESTGPGRRSADGSGRPGQLTAGLCAVGVGLLLALAATAPATAAQPQAPGATCDNGAPPGTRITPVPWAQQVLAPQRVQALSTGAHITVAVIDSGVDGGHPQLAGRVLAGFDFLRNAAGGDVDCASHGTAVASLIAAQHLNGVGFQGLAPGVKILPVRVSEHEDSTGGDAVSPDVFAKAIRWAADNGGQIINISLTLDTNYPAVADAVDYAIRVKGCLIVAAVGNHHNSANDTTGTPSLGARVTSPSDPPSYPAAYPGVLGVGAVTRDGVRLPESQVGSSVDLVAPGGEVLAATRVQGYATWSGTSFAAPLVSAAAALVWSNSPQLRNTDVAWRLEATADPVASGRHAEYGYGLLDPYRAVTEVLGGPSSAPGPIPARSLDVAAKARASAWHTDGMVALGAGLLILVLVLGAGLLAISVRRARVRHWQPAPPPPLPRHEPVEEPDEAFFVIPQRAP